MGAAEQHIKDAKLTKLKPESVSTSIPDYEVLIIGAGISGMAAAIELKRRGIESFQILERADDVGGTWRDNNYPGIAVDIMSFVYTYSFEQNPDWSRLYAPGAELKRYMRKVACKYGLYRSTRFGVVVNSAEFDESKSLWRVNTNQGFFTARHLTSAVGSLVEPKKPTIRGIDDFQGKCMHTARWDQDYDLTGKRVALIGTGATGVQVVPEIAEQVEHLDVYQRTPIWIIPKPDARTPFWLRTLFRLSSTAQKGMRLSTHALTELVMVVGVTYFKQMPWLVRMLENVCLKNLHKQLPEQPDLWKKLTPKYGFGCKRPTFSNEYFKTFSRDNVELVTDSIDCITASGIKTKDGKEREIDVLILATGFEVFGKKSFPTYPVLGRGGIDLREYWYTNRYQAFEGLTVPGYPNFYMFMGPYALTATSYFVMAEGNAVHMARCVEEARKRGAEVVEVKQEVHDRYFEEIQKRQQSTVFLNNNCGDSSSYYFDHHGDAPLARPSTSMEMLLRAKYLSMDNYRFIRGNR
ncbi:flavin-containing monooxygenase [Zhongshania arctica]|uniref:Flavin-containing monooxygenase n=1 Tax=Zhongshania arctica TaxID=3238302 RepID=A0ABV3TRL8_9GAMM